MGYWHIGNTNNLYPSPSPASRILDTSICTDVCTISVCNYDSSSAPRVDYKSRLPRTPLVDFGISEWPYSSSDYGYYPDLQMFPAFAGAVVPIYHIPELIDSKTPIVFSRATVTGIFLGKIRYWNDTNILHDNANSTIYKILASCHKPITVTVRHDSSGISMILAEAFNSFDPATGAVPDYSFANTAGQTTALAKPKWCDPLTDEVYYFKVSQCLSSWSPSQKMVTMRVVDPSLNVRSLNWPCDISGVDLQLNFLQQVGIQVTVNQQYSSDSMSWTYQVGLSDRRLITTNWYRPVVSWSRAQVKVLTLQEGGFWNAHYKISSYFITPSIQSVFVLNSSYPAVQFNLTYQGVNGAFSTTTRLDSSVSDLSSTLASYLNSIVPQGVTVSKIPSTAAYSSSRWVQYRVTFTEQRNVPLLGVSATYKASSLAGGIAIIAGGTATTATTFVTGYLDYNNYPRFSDPAYVGVPSGGRYTCYKRSLNYVPFSYLTAALAEMNAQVCFLKCYF